MVYELKYNFIKHATAIIIFLFFSIISYGQFIMGAGYINTVATNAIYKGNQITFNAYDKVYNGFYAGSAMPSPCLMDSISLPGSISSPSPESSLSES